MTEETYLLIPAHGLVEVFIGEHLDIPTALITRGGDGVYVVFDVTANGGHIGWVHWLENSVGPINPRAREAMVTVTGVYVTFTGPVLFTGLRETQVFEIVAGLSRKE